MGKPESKRPLGRSGRRCDDNSKTDFQEVGCGGTDWIELAQGRDSRRTLVKTVINLRAPYNGVNYLTSCQPVSF